MNISWPEPSIFWLDQRIRTATRLHMKFPVSLSLGFAVLLLSGVLVWLASAQSRSPSETAPAADRGEIVALLKDITVLQEKVVEGLRLSYQAGQPVRLLPAEIDLAKARLELAKELRQPDQMMAELEQIVKLHEREVGLQQQRLTSGRSRAVDVTKAQIGLLKARLRLAKARIDVAN